MPESVSFTAGYLKTECESRTGRAAADALRRRGYDVVEIDGDRALDVQLRREDVGVVFNALHGTFGEDGRLQGMLDWMGIPYTGEGLRSSLSDLTRGLRNYCIGRRSGGVRCLGFGEPSLKFLCRGCPLQFSSRGQAGRARLERRCCACSGARPIPGGP